eukprot:TRINITY_DN9168_c0_g1_i1.p2 TRINITY_DN9168_c0_g1~~TRINITY_DN9168_c0_g1_i1.p2  ORF type:complete len:206 (-),score=42.03 TRINITY_DN9168_c0_g1_i1:8-625(-)
MDLLPYVGQVRELILCPCIKESIYFAAAASILLHVCNYNVTAHLEHNTRIFTRILGRNAVYYYAIYLIASAIVRDILMEEAIKADPAKLSVVSASLAAAIGYSLFVFGCFLNLWTLKALGVKGMYNGDSFGHLMDAPVTSGPYVFFSDPQYFGSTLLWFGLAIVHQSPVGLALSAVLGATYHISATRVEGPHMARLYSRKPRKTE